MGGKLQTTSSFTDPYRRRAYVRAERLWRDREGDVRRRRRHHYTHDAVIPDQLFTTGGTEPFILRRANAFRRISLGTLNGVPLTNSGVSPDSLGRVVSSARQGSGSGNVTRWTYDANGWPLRVAGERFAQFIERDSTGRIPITTLAVAAGGARDRTRDDLRVAPLMTSRSVRAPTT